MLRRFFRRIQPHIIPEFKLFWKRIIWIGLALSSLVYLLTDAPYTIRDPWKLFGLAFLLGIGAVYVTRIFGWLVLSVIRGIRSVHGEIFTEAEIAKKSRRRR